MKPNNKFSDKELILKYKSGDKLAVSLLVKKWHLHFCRLAFWYVKDADVAKDVAQESWTIILNKISTLEQPEKFKPWAISIVNRKAIDFLRKEKSNQNKLEKYYSENTQRNRGEGNDDGELNQYHKKIREEINKLSNHHQQVITLFYREEYTLKEISEILDISVGTAKSRLFHAREKLKSILKKYNHE
ncbi:RNA polymerase sigma-70 factor (ECF subfamily) [Lutibacter sp. Hel_I_33_5]|uniref:RNA polymerase sigma factor n=1 Tax=Lutibacter sp. Hel_I_33_5 TaxID=1566289 RepID=UPI00119EB512|nr:RNA polymerase sigma factor [Lutibacter sp. Hel_I_33_5]TVZ54782.1 RNA polymerase sigma-70 factor (ECF subfamily) [Lutibacter sp. Hel_I_33_5]